MLVISDSPYLNIDLDLVFFRFMLVHYSFFMFRFVRIKFVP